MTAIQNAKMIKWHWSSYLQFLIGNGLILPRTSWLLGLQIFLYYENIGRHNGSKYQSKGAVLHQYCVWFKGDVLQIIYTSLLRRLQAQTLSDEAPPIGKIHPFSKTAIPFEPVMQFGCSSGFRMGFYKGWPGCSKGFPEEEPCQPFENPILPKSFIQI